MMIFPLSYMRNFFNEFHLFCSGNFRKQVLRGMVDEFYMFDCPLQRPDILTLMHRCKIYWSK